MLTATQMVPSSGTATFAASKRNETGQPANWYFEESATSVGVSVGGVGEVVRVCSLVLKNQLFPGWWSTEELVLKEK